MTNQEKTDEIEIGIKIPTRISWVALALVIIVSGLFYVITEDLEKTLLFVAALSAGTGSIVGAIYVLRTLQAQINQTIHSNQIKQEEISHTKKVQAFSLALRWNDPGMTLARQTCRELINTKSQSGEDRKSFSSDPSKIDNVIHVLNFLEEIALAIKMDIVDREVISSLFKDIFLQVWEALEPWIKEYRNKREAPDMWEHFEAIRKDFLKVS